MASLLGEGHELGRTARALADAADRGRACAARTDERPLPMRVHEALIEAAAIHEIEDDAEIDELVASLSEHAAADPRLAALRSDLDRAAAPPDADRPIRVAFLGEFSTGKSSLINALLGGAVQLPEGMAPVTASLTEIRHADQPHAELRYADGRAEVVDFAALEQHADQRSVETDERPERIILGVPAEVLRSVTILDTPGFNSDNLQHEQAAQQVITEADVVLWVFKATMAGRRSVVGHLAYVERALDKSIGVINYIDAVRPKQARDPKAWSAALDGVEAELHGLFDSGFEGWVRTSAEWIREGREDGGRDALVATRLELGAGRFPSSAGGASGASSRARNLPAARLSRRRGWRLRRAKPPHGRRGRVPSRRRAHSGARPCRCLAGLLSSRGPGMGPWSGLLWSASQGRCTPRQERI
ncbi:MAG: dynamin family protein [Planctomycetota bacterium]|nr:dynamin family protein [Planctomycetota bacterium]